MHGNFKWIVAAMIFMYANFFDVIHAAYCWEEMGSVTVFVDIVFGNDWLRKLLFCGLFALLIAGCEVSE